jgi:tight adherence protein B
MNIDPLQILVTAAIFGLVLAIWMIVVLLWSRRSVLRRQRLQDRLSFVPAAATGERVLRLWHDGQEATTTIAVWHRMPWWSRVKLMGMHAGWRGSLTAVGIGLAVAVLVAIAVVWQVTHNLLVGFLGGVAIVMLFRAYVQRRIETRTTLFEAQFLDALEIAVRSLRAGHPLTGSFRFIAQEIPAPVGPMFDEICEQQTMGMSLEDAVRKVAAESPSQDVKIFASAVVVQSRSGGQLADVMERLAAVVRDRHRLTARARVLTAQARVSKHVLLAMPFILFIVLNLLSPDYMEPLYTTSAGQLILAVAGVLLLIGVWVMNKLAVVHY